MIGRLDKSGDVSDLASRHGDSTWRAGGGVCATDQAHREPGRSHGRERLQADTRAGSAALGKELAG